MNIFKNRRRKSALQRLEDQLASGMKQTKQGLIPLKYFDKKRIENEINTLSVKLLSVR